MSDPLQPLPVELILACSWLGIVAGGIPDELRGRAPFSALLAAGNRKSPADDEKDRGARGENPQRAEAPISSRDLLLSGIENLLRQYESDWEQKRSGLASELTRVRAALTAMETELDRERSENFRLERNNSDLRNAATAQEMEMSAIKDERTKLLSDVDKWKTEVEVILESRSNQIEQAKSECRRDFIKTTRTNLGSLRGLLIELKGQETSGTASLAATALDEVIRVMHSQKFLTPEELPRLQPQSKGRG
jgi:chromosome segregation ATPase